jgi:hypothetical protein
VAEVVFWGGHLECLKCALNNETTDFECKLSILHKQCPVLHRKEEKK